MFIVLSVSLLSSAACRTPAVWQNILMRRPTSLALSSRS